MPKIQTYTANLSREGSTGSVRGKIPATLISAMGGDDGDVMEFQLNGKTLVGGRIITGKEARALRSQGRQNFGAVAPKAQPVKAPAKSNGRTVGKPTLAAPKAKTASKASATKAKASKNKTSVAIKSRKGQAKSGRVKPRFFI